LGGLSRRTVEQVKLKFRIENYELGKSMVNYELRIGYSLQGKG
jgi:hypothetical protein